MRERKALNVKAEKSVRPKYASVVNSTLTSDGSGGGSSPSNAALSPPSESGGRAAPEKSCARCGCCCRWAFGSASTRAPSASESSSSICRRPASGPGRIRLCRRMRFELSSRMRAPNASRSRASDSPSRRSRALDGRPKIASSSSRLHSAFNSNENR